LAPVDVTTGGVLVAFSTAPGKSRSTAIARKDSPFTAALLSRLEITRGQKSFGAGDEGFR